MRARMRKTGTLVYCGETVKWYHFYGKIKGKIDPAIPLWGILPKEWKAGPRRDICSCSLKHYSQESRWKSNPKVDG